MTSKSSVSRSKDKPAKPYPDFPLFAHGTRRWAKKIRGKHHYFGPWEDPDAALQMYLDQGNDLYAGRTPRSTAGGLTIRDLGNHFLSSKRHLLDTSELSPRTFRDYRNSCARIVKAFGRGRLVDDLAANEFRELRAGISKSYGPVALGNEVQRIRSVFKYAYEASLIDKPIRFGPGFKKPSRKVLRQARQANGLRMFESEELQRIVAVTTAPLKAMVLLGVNCGFGQSDVGSLPIGAGVLPKN